MFFLGEETWKSLSSRSKDEKEKFFHDVRNIFHSIASYLKLNLPLNNAFLRDLQILDFSCRSDPEGKECIEYHDIDFYWNKVFSICQNNGQPKYLTLWKLIKNVLIISHGNADVERGFSINGNILTEERSLLSEKSVNGLRTTFDAVQFLGDGSAHNVKYWTIFSIRIQFLCIRCQSLSICFVWYRNQQQYTKKKHWKWKL